MCNHPELIYKTNKQINSDVESFLSQYHPSLELPIPIEEIIDLKLRIDIIPIPGLKEASNRVGLNIDAFISSDFKHISVDENIQYNVYKRYRFSLAHEIGHRMLHGYLYNLYEFSSSEEWIVIINSMPEKTRKMVEFQANEFAGQLLVPPSLFEEAYEDALEYNKVAFNIMPKEEIAKEFAFATLAEKFAVSEEVIRIRFQVHK